MVLHRSHFDRLFKKRNPRTTRDLAHMAELQLARRALKPNILDCAPLLKCFIYKLQELQGSRRQDDDSRDHFVVPAVYYEDPHSRESGTTSSANSTRDYCWMAATRDLHYCGTTDTCSVRSSIGSRCRTGIDSSLSVLINDHRSMTSSLNTTTNTTTNKT